MELKLIWDFRGPDAELTAKHHAVHLGQFLKTENLQLDISGYSKIDKEHFIAYLVVMEGEMKPVRDALKPHRGAIYSEDA